MQQQRMQASGLRVAGALCQGYFDALARLVQPPLPLEPRRQTEPRMNGIRFRHHGTFKAAARSFCSAEAVILLAEQNEQRSVAWRELLGSLESLVGKGKIQVVRGRDAELEPQLHHPWESSRQIAIAR